MHISKFFEKERCLKFESKLLCCDCGINCELSSYKVIEKQFIGKDVLFSTKINSLVLCGVCVEEREDQESCLMCDVELGKDETHLRNDEPVCEECLTKFKNPYE